MIDYTENTLEIFLNLYIITIYLYYILFIIIPNLPYPNYIPHFFEPLFQKYILIKLKTCSRI